MNLARVIGTVVGSTRGDSIPDSRFLLIECSDETGKGTGECLVALDLVEARQGDMVMFAQGSSCRWTFETDDQPIDTLIVGIIDSIDSADTSIYRG